MVDKEIKVGAVYSLDEFKKRSGLNDHAMRMAKRNGLRTYKVGRRVYVAGTDWTSFLEGKVNE